jgi:ethanolamine ammonia-lyase small subunit
MTDAWAGLRAATRARVGLGRTGDALPTSVLLDLWDAHALARDAVHAPLDVAAVLDQLGARPHVVVDSAAPDRAAYLQRPDLGRRLSDTSRAALSPGHHDLVVVLADGLSAQAVEAHAVPLLDALTELLDGWRLAPVVVALQARVALGDEVGELMGATASLVLIGERPGLSAADSLGAYLTWRPRPGRRDAERNCVSNIRPPHGLPVDRAAQTLARLLTAARTRGLSGVGLKDDVPALP